MANVAENQIEVTIHERGNGLVDVGDYVPGTDGELYEVISLVGPIHTGAPGAGSYVHAVVELADWDDVEEEDVSTCQARIEVAS